MIAKVKIFKGKVGSVESEINEFLSPKKISDEGGMVKEERIKIKTVTQSFYDTLNGSSGVVISIFYTTQIVNRFS